MELVGPNPLQKEAAFHQIPVYIMILPFLNEVNKPHSHLRPASMSSSNFPSVLTCLMILIYAVWTSLWVLKPTQFWTKIWKDAEDSANKTVFGYYGLNYAAYAFPVIAVAIIGLVFLDLKSRERRCSKSRSLSAFLSGPLVVNSLLGILSSIEILLAFLFIIFLTWTFYARISNDFKKLIPDKSLKLDLWELKYLRVATRFGLLAEASLALLLLPVLRGLAVFSILGIQFEASVRYHAWVGTAVIFFSAIHGGSTLLIWGVSNHIQNEIWKWQKTGRIYLAGEIALVAGIVIWFTSLPQIRRRNFEIFYYSHHLYLVFLVFFLFHAGDKHFYMVFPGVLLFGLDKLLRIIQSRPRTCIVSARVFPCRAVELILPKDPRLNYAPTSVIFMKIPTISNLQWHSFSITSSSTADEHKMSVIIKCEGWWTSSLYNMIHAELGRDSAKMKGIPVAIEGPYGPASLDFLKYDTLLLVAGGSGITPFLSILAEVSSATSKNRFPTRMQLVYVIKKAQDFSLLHSISHLLVKESPGKCHLKLKLFITREKQPGLRIRDLLSEFFEVKTLHLNTECSSYAVHGPESPTWMAAILGLCSIIFLIVLICLNHMIPSEKGSKKSKDNKTPSWIVDMLLMASFVIALACSSVMGIFLRLRKLQKGIPRISKKEHKPLDFSSTETRSTLEEHEVHFGGRPSFQDIFGEFENESGGTNIGVLVCGPESMKESVAEICQQKSKKSKACFTFNSLNFTL